MFIFFFIPIYKTLTDLVSWPMDYSLHLFNLYLFKREHFYYYFEIKNRILSFSVGLC